MIRKFFTPLALVAVMVAGAQAAIFTDTAEFAAGSLSPPLPAPLSFTEIGNAGVSSGRSFTNQGGIPAGSVAGTFQVVGNRIRTVGGVLLSGATSSTLGDLLGIYPAGAAGSQFAILFGVEGVVGPNAATGVFTKGGVRIIEVVAGTFNSQDPSTWQVGGTVAAEYTISAPDSVSPGTPTGFAVPAAKTISESDINVGAINLAINGFSQGAFLFEELSPNDQLLNSDSGQAPPPGLVWDGKEYLIVETQQFTLDQTEANVVGNGPLNGADLTQLNLLASFAFGDVFASSIGANGLDTDFSVPTAGLPNTEGVDFVSSFGFGAFPALKAVPEPMSALIWGILGLSFFSRRNTRQHRLS